MKPMVKSWARISHMISTRAKPHNNCDLCKQVLRPDMLPYYTATDSCLVFW